jgi:hypothetical protein
MVMPQLPDEANRMREPMGKHLQPVKITGISIREPQKSVGVN